MKLKTKASGVSEKAANTFVFCLFLCVGMRGGEMVSVGCLTDLEVSTVNRWKPQSASFECVCVPVYV